MSGKYVIGVCGGTGAGKGVVSGIFRLHGAYVVDCDAVSRDVVSVGKPALAEIYGAFGLDYRLADGSLDRGKLASLVYSSPSAKAKLEKITHPRIMDEVRRQIGEHDGIVVIDAPVLFEAGADAICDCIIGVIADRETRISRVTARDGISREAAIARIDAQKSDGFLHENCDYLIYNNASVTELDKQVAAIIGKVYSDAE